MNPFEILTKFGSLKCLFKSKGYRKGRAVIRPLFRRIGHRFENKVTSVVKLWMKVTESGTKDPWKLFEVLTG